jgi:hypothetical protein
MMLPALLARFPGSLVRSTRRSSLFVAALVSCTVALGSQGTLVAAAEPPAAPVVVAAPVAAAPPAKPVAPPRAILVYSAPPGETLPAELRRELDGNIHIPSPGPLSLAAQALRDARQALRELRCSEALPLLSQASEKVLAEVLLPDARPLLSEMYGIMLVCADRVSDGASAQRASTALRAMQATLPADVLLVQGRYPEQPLFGPPRAPVHIESDPPGAVVLRNLVPVGVTPLDVPGGVPELDFIDVELPGYHKLHRPLGTNQQLLLALRPEERIPLLFDRVGLFPPNSEQQLSAVQTLADQPAARVWPTRRILVVGPKQRDGTPMAGETLIARVYDLDRRLWSGPPAEIASGAAAAQAQALLALTAGPPPPQSPTSAAALAPAAAVAAPKPVKGGFRLPFANTKWYTWVVAGGVAALIAGLLIAEKFSPEKLTISATH